MPSIQQLPEAVYARIAAGEVIVRPAAAVKELIENAIDAGATGISVEITDGGKELIRVTDNGSGISSADLPLAVARHATSKISTFDDLYRLRSLGFRGEALSSMAEVSRFSIATRVKGEELGSRLTMAGGDRPAIEPAGVPEGTTVRVEDLFYNVPARRKFLKTGGREGALVSEVVRRAILSSPHIAFKFIRNGKVVYQSPGTGDVGVAASSVYGPDVQREFMPIQWEESGCVVSGQISRPTYIFKSAQRIDFFVNGRYIQSKSLQHALMRGYGESMLHGHYPCAVINVQIDPGMIDINVHPAKLNAVFYDEELVESAVANAVRNILGTGNGAPHITLSDNRSDSKSSELDKSSHRAATPDPDFWITVPRASSVDSNCPAMSAASGDAATPGSTKGEPENGRIHPLQSEARAQTMDDRPIPSLQKASDTVQPSNADAFAALVQSTSELQAEDEEPTVDVRTLQEINVLGSAFATYIIVESDGRLFFIDQHAARERLTYERLLAWTKHGERYGQMMLIPVVRTFLANEFAVLQDHADLLGKLGLSFEEFGELTLRFFSFPLEMRSSDIDAFLSDVIAELKDHPDDPVLARDRLIVSACRHSVKSGTTLTDEEMRSLVHEITDMDAIPFCPHGRPIAVEITREQLEKGFRRRV